MQLPWQHGKCCTETKCWESLNGFNVIMISRISDILLTDHILASFFFFNIRLVYSVKRGPAFVFVTCSFYMENISVIHGRIKAMRHHFLFKFAECIRLGFFISMDILQFSRIGTILLFVGTLTSVRLCSFVLLTANLSIRLCCYSCWVKWKSHGPLHYNSYQQSVRVTL